MKITSTFSRSILMLMTSGLLSFQLAQAQKITYSDPSNKAGFTLNEQSRGGVSISFAVESFTLEPANINGRGMDNIELPGFWLPNDEGAPNLPGSGKYIAIPQGSVPVLRIISQRTESYKNIDIAPAPRIPLDTDTGPLIYPTRTDIYSSNDFYPASPFTLSRPSKIRGVDVVMVGVTPFQYNPVTKELIVYRDVEIRIEFQGGNGQIGEERLRSRFWDPILNDAVLNYKSIPEIDYNERAISSNRSDGCEYLIIVPDGPDYMTWANQIKSFRIKQGITTEIRTLTEVGGNTAGIIEAYINNAYNTWDPAPAAILLMGDYGTNQNSNIMSPIWDGYCVSDNIYGDVDNDNMPEIIMARMVANNNTELETFVTKFINYETNPPTSPAFYDHPITALGWQTERWFQICSEVVGGYFKNVQGKNPVRVNEIYDGNPSYDPWSTAPNTSTVLNFFGPNGLGYIPATPQELGNWSGGNATAVNNAINDGSFLLQHRDHGMETGWGEPAYVNSNINGLTNTDLTFIFSINCLTGKYNWSGECFSEKFHRYKYNNMNSGALGVICASEVSYSFVNDTYVWGLYDNMWPDFMPAYGSTPSGRGLLPAFGNAAGKYFLQQSGWPYNSGDKEVTYNLFHHFGDAFQTLYSEVPQDLTVMHDGILLAGMNEFMISADAGSTICLTANDSIIGLAQGTGTIQVITLIPQDVGTFVTLTVTKTNYYRHEESLQVIPAEGAYCLYTSHTLDDVDGGNGNGLVDYNETIGLSLNIRNVGMADGNGITVTVTTTDPFIDFVDNSEFYGDIPAGQSVTIENGFTFYVTENIPDQELVMFDISSTDGTNTWVSHFMVIVNAAELHINEMILDDLVNGNGNGKLDPGEQVTMTINYTNTGHAVAYNVDVRLEGQSGFVEILNPDQEFSDIGLFGTFNKVFDVIVDEEAPEGIIVDFVNELTMGIYFQDRIFSEKISNQIEDFETGDFSKYDWQFAGTLPWDIIVENPYQGTYNAKSGDITGNQTSEIYITYDVMAADSIIFMRKISSEPNDKLKFYVGDELMGEWSGASTGWQKEAYFITPGNKTFRWVYVKNGSTSSGADRGWLDNINLPSPSCLAIWAGPDEKVCAGEPFQFSESYGIDYISVHWTSSGTGTFNDNTLIQPAYTPSNEDMINGSVELTLTLTGIEGNTVNDAMMLTFKNEAEAPQTAQGPVYVDLFVTTTSDYVTAGIPGINEYAWYLAPAEAGTIQGTSLASAVAWNPDFLGIAYISVAAIGECGEGEVSEALEVTVDNTVGIGDPGLNGIRLAVYPNPSHGLFNLKISTGQPGLQRIKLFNILGETIISKTVMINHAMDYQLNLEELPNGIYFLEIGSNDQVVTRKLVKK